MTNQINKRPSFQFYPKDYLSDPNVMAMTPAERGAYWHLIATMWTTENCELLNDDDYLANLSGLTNQPLTNIKRCFKISSTNPQCITHKRLQIERLKQDNWQEKSRLAGIESGKVRRKKAKMNHRSNLVEPKGNSSTSSSIASPSSISNNKSTIVDSDKSVQYGNEDINKMLIALKGKIGIQSFVDSTIERMIAKHCVDLMAKIGKDEFIYRLEALLKDSFHQKNCNKIKYVYNNIKGFIEKKSSVLTIIK